MKPEVVIVGLGPAGPDLVTAGTLEAIASTEHRFVRTARHPSVGVLGRCHSFDHVYEAAGSFDEAYERMAADLLDAADSHGRILYAVPGSPLVAETTVGLLVSDDRVATMVVPALSFADLAWARLRLDPVAEGVRLVDGRRFGVEAAGERGPLLVAQCDNRMVLSEMKLAVDEPPADPVTVLHHLGLPEERIYDVSWDELDRLVATDHLTSVYIPELAAPIAVELSRFAELVRRLREECPWDRQQSHASLKRYLLEETYEVLEAIDGLDPESAGGFDQLEEELGDLLFQVVFHATIAAEEGRFTLADVARVVHDKLRARHPHVFGDVEAADAEEVRRNWEQIKRDEKPQRGVMEAIPQALPALALSTEVLRSAAALGLNPVAAEADRLRLVELVAELGTEVSGEEIGRVLVALVQVCLAAGVDAEDALRLTASGLRNRCREWEQLARRRGRQFPERSADEMAALWSEMTGATDSTG
ncbi:MAG: hypothetical protein JJLCMIEE_00828 [Acidimicrobiales bacterium]|nr:hypothetical protein [Acidimicrobiales bacterium]